MADTTYTTAQIVRKLKRLRDTNKKRLNREYKEGHVDGCSYCQEYINGFNEAIAAFQKTRSTK